MEPFTMLLASAAIGGGINLVSGLMSESSKTEEDKKKAQNLENLNEQVSKLKLARGVEYEQQQKNVEAMFNSLSSKTREAIMSQANEQMKLSAEEFEHSAARMKKDLSKRGDDYSKFLGEEIDKYAKQIKGATKEATASWKSRGVTGSAITDSIGKLEQQDRRYRSDMAENNRKFQEDIAYKIADAEEQLAFGKSHTAKQILAQAGAQVSNSDLAYAGQQAGSLQNLVAQRMNENFNQTMGQITNQFQIDTLKDSQINWGNVFGSALQGAAPSLQMAGGMAAKNLFGGGTPLTASIGAAGIGAAGSGTASPTGAIGSKEEAMRIQQGINATRNIPASATGLMTGGRGEGYDYWQNPYGQGKPPAGYEWIIPK